MTVEEKDTIIATIEMKSEESPMINLLGKDLRKSGAVYRDVRMPTNINTEVVEAKREIESDIMNILKRNTSILIRTSRNSKKSSKHNGDDKSANNCRVEEKDTIIATIEMKSEESPMINLLGKDLRKSGAVYRDVRMPTNINTEVVEAKREIESDIMNILKRNTSILIRTSRNSKKSSKHNGDDKSANNCRELHLRFVEA
ncbi:hypothetical protein QQP08_011447 [Theobroma cacao]|nr:hypothetical protein QQP08_011447 [Theobroma cacao]